MSYLIFVFILLGNLLVVDTAHADALTEKKIEKLNVPQDDKSVYQLHFWSDASTLLAGSIISVGANSISYSLINRRCPCDPSEVNIIDRRVTANDNKLADIMANYTVSAAMIAPVVIDYLDVGFSKSFIEDMVVYGDVLMVNFGLVTIAKYATQRPYPYIYRESSSANFQSDPSDYLSFYSGHTSTTIAALSSAAVTLNLRHKKTLWPWILTAAMGTSIGIELVISGEHFTTDVIVGALMGVAIGTIVPGLHARNHEWFHNIFIVSELGGPEIVWRQSF